MDEENFQVSNEPVETVDSQQTMDDAFLQGLNQDLPEQETEEQPQKLNLGDLGEFDYQDAVNLIQKGLNTPKIEAKIQALESDPRIQFLEVMAMQNGLSIEDYMESVQYAQEEQAVYELMQEHDISEDDARKFLEQQGFFDERNAREEAAVQNQLEDLMLLDFVENFQETNGRLFDPEKDQIPETVWQQVHEGVPLRYAYLEHETKQLRDEIKRYKQKSMFTSDPIIDDMDTFLTGFNSVK